MYKNILLIDDSTVDNFLNSTFIKNCDLCESIEIFGSARSALTFLHNEEKKFKHTPNVIFLDIDMPEMDGFQFLDEYAKLPAPVTEAFKVIVLSSSISSEEIDRAKEHPHVSKFISKPLTAHVLLNLHSEN